jgi:hypothetical protein
MAGFEFTFLFGAIVGALVGWFFGRISLLWKMHHDDIESAHTSYKRRRERYLGKRD